MKKKNDEEGEEKENQAHFDWKDVVAFLIAIFEIFLLPFLLLIAILVIVILILWVFV